MKKNHVYPGAGDAVILTGKWSTEEPGSIGIIGGVVGEKRETLGITFNFSAFRGRSTGYAKETEPIYVSVSGGPGTIALPASLLKPTRKTVTVRFWRWKDMPRRDGGEIYQLEVPLWEWDGKGH